MGSFVCQSDCYDIVPDHCPRWAGNGECGANPDYMHLNCRQSCGMCGEYKRRELVLLLRNILESRKMKGGPKGSPKPTGDIGPLPTGFDDLGPMPTGFDDLGPTPTGDDLGSLFDALGSSFDAFFDPSYDASFDPVPTTD